MTQANTISSNILLSSELLSAEDSFTLSIELEKRLELTTSEIIGLNLPARNRVEALLQNEFMEEKQFREIACNFAEHTLHVFESACPNDPRPRKFVKLARAHYAGEASAESLKAAFIETWKAIEVFEGRTHISAFAAGLAASLLHSGKADKMARDVALCAQNATHRKEWEGRKSDLELMVGREKEALWQLKHIVEKLT